MTAPTTRRRGRRTAAAAVSLAGLAALAACGSSHTVSDPPASASPVASGTASPSASSTSSGTASPSTSASSSGDASAQTQTLPDGTTTLFPGHRVVAFYGAAGAPTLGVLGTASANGIWPRLSHQADDYDGDGLKVMPAYELITYVATGSPGSDGTYAQKISSHTIDDYVSAAKSHHALVILDIQPGRGDFLTDAKTLAPWLEKPNVALALDPEWKLTATQKPDVQIGHTDAAAVNAVSAWLEQLTVAHHLPQKLLLVHQFVQDEIRGKGSVEQRPHLAIAFNMDGFGTRAAKLSKYKLLKKYPQFPIGIKLFYKQDIDIFTPSEAAKLNPTPDIVDYE